MCTMIQEHKHSEAPYMHTHTLKKAGPGGEHEWQSNIKNKQKPYAFPQKEFGNILKEWFQKVKIVDN